jgi:hypothetical protein
MRKAETLRQPLVRSDIGYENLLDAGLRHDGSLMRYEYERRAVDVYRECRLVMLFAALLSLTGGRGPMARTDLTLRVAPRRRSGRPCACRRVGFSSLQPSIAAGSPFLPFLPLSPYFLSVDGGICARS